jgi:hypothetical protein
VREVVGLVPDDDELAELRRGGVPLREVRRVDDEPVQQRERRVRPALGAADAVDVPQLRARAEGVEEPRRRRLAAPVAKGVEVERLEGLRERGVAYRARR